MERSLKKTGKKRLVNGIINKEVWLYIYNNIKESPHSIGKLPKWCGERPGKKSGDPNTPEEEDTKEEVEEVGEIDDIMDNDDQIEDENEQEEEYEEEYEESEYEDDEEEE